MYHTQAIILKKDEWNEADWLITALSEDFGKIRLLAQGARKHGAKLQGHLEPGTIAGISLVIGRNGYRLTTARLQEFFPNIRASFSKWRTLAIILNLLETNMFEEARGASQIFSTASEVLSELERAEDLATARRLLIWFYVRFFAFLGLLPSSLSSEGQSIPTLLSLAQSPVSRLRPADFPEGILESELAWLMRKLGSAIKAAPAPTLSVGAPTSTGTIKIGSVGAVAPADSALL